jgi:hypothetical protein
MHRTGCEMSRRGLGAEIARAIFRANRPSEAKPRPKGAGPPRLSLIGGAQRSFILSECKRLLCVLKYPCQFDQQLKFCWLTCLTFPD